MCISSILDVPAPPHTSRHDHRIGGRAWPLPSFGLEVGIRIEPLFVFLPATHPQPLHLNLIVTGAPTPRDMPIDDGTRPLGDGVRKEASIRFAYLCCLLRQSAGAFHARRHALARLREPLLRRELVHLELRVRPVRAPPPRLEVVAAAAGRLGQFAASPAAPPWATCAAAARPARQRRRPARRRPRAREAAAASAASAAWAASDSAAGLSGRLERLRGSTQEDVVLSLIHI